MPTGPCRREFRRNSAPLSSLLNLPNGVFSEEYDIVEGTFTAEDLREKARRMKREEMEARQRAKRARKKREYSAEAVHKQDALARKRRVELLNKQAAKAIFDTKNKVQWSNHIEMPPRCVLSLSCDARVAQTEWSISTACMSTRLLNTQSRNFSRLAMTKLFVSLSVRLLHVGSSCPKDVLTPT